MSENRFKFVSPGIFINEIDESQLPRTAEDIGPVVIGRATRGPIMRPVKVQSYKEFVEIFGTPEAGAKNVDYWRQGGFAAPSYGGFAAQAYLKNAGPLTYVRLGGYENPDKDTDGSAGWEVAAQGSGSITDSGGAFGLFLAPLSSSGVAFENNIATAKLAAVFYVDSATVTLSGSGISGGTVGNKAGVWVKADANSNLTLAFDNSSKITKKVVSFKANSEYFIRNGAGLNTTPSKINTDINSAAGAENYWLGQTYENSVQDIITNGGGYAAIILPLQDAASSTKPEECNNAGNFSYEAKGASSGWIFSQHKEVANSWDFDANTNDFSGASVQKLFKIHTLSEDEWTQKNIKISIDNIKRSTNKYSNFGSFSVIVRKMFDNDVTPAIIERFDECNLDPSSPNFIAKKIGDIHTEWDYQNKRFKEYGDYPNRSKYVYVEVHEDVKNGAIDQDLLPFGFYGPQVFKSVTDISASANTFSNTLASSTSFFSTLMYVGPSGISGSTGVVANVPFTASFAVPELPVVMSSTDHYAAANLSSLYWGLKTSVGTTTQANKEIVDHLRPLPLSIKDEEVSNTSKTKYSLVFSLDDISGSYVTQGNSIRIKSAVWEQGARQGEDTLSAVLTGSQYDTFLSTLGRFNVPLFGGFEGLDITEKEPFSHRAGGPLDSNNDNLDPKNSYALNSLLTAIDAVSDPDVLDMDILAVPGIKHKVVHQSMLNACEGRADALAILDLKGDYVSSYEVDPDTETESDRQPSVFEAVSYIKDTLSPNTSYGAAYFPWVQIQDETTSNLLWVPPSVVALGTFASTKRNAAVWFAPAGFNRGGLSSDTRPAGLKVINSKLQLKAKDRDALYEVGINPIVKFPSEGVVIFGQKTLQQTASALDRVNVRRLMNFIKKEISRISTGVLFDPNVQLTWDRFTGAVNPFLDSVRSGLGITEYRVLLDETTTTPELVDRNILYAKIFIKPARAIEFIALDFTITNSGASFND